MARQRILKPGMNDDEDMVTLPLETRYFYVNLWPWLDRQALIEEVPLSIRSKLFPREEIPLAHIEHWIMQLTRQGPSGRPRLVRVKWRGKSLLYCPTLKRHGRIYSDEPELFRVPEEVLKQAREAMNVFIDENGDAIDPPAPPPPPTRNSEGPARNLGEPPSQCVPSSASASASVPASVSTSASASVPASARDEDTGPGPGSGAGIGLRPWGTGPGAGTQEPEPLDFTAPELVGSAIDEALASPVPEPPPPPGPAPAPDNVLPFRPRSAPQPAPPPTPEPPPPEPVAAAPRAPERPPSAAPAPRRVITPRPAPPGPRAPVFRTNPERDWGAMPDFVRRYSRSWREPLDSPVTSPKEASA